MATKKTTAPKGQPKACPDSQRLSYEEASPKTRALVDHAAAARADFCWTEIEDRILAEAKMTEAEVVELRVTMAAYFRAAAVRIFDARAENPAEWPTWLKALREVMTEAGVRFAEVQP
jgi:hypothetical protein